MTTDSSGQSARLLLEIARVFDDQHVAYAAIGALAAAYYGVVRASLDADVVIALGKSQTTLDQLVAAICGSGLTATVRLGDETDPLLGVVAVEDAHRNRVDIILGIRGMDSGLFERAVTAPLLGSSLRMVGIDDFIAMKVFAGGPRDIEDVRGVLKVSRGLVDVERVRQLTEQYGERERSLFDSLLEEPT